MGFPGCSSWGLSAPVPEAEHLLLLHAFVEPKETLHRDLLQSWEQAAGCLCPSCLSPIPWEPWMLQKAGLMGDSCEG